MLGRLRFLGVFLGFSAHAKTTGHKITTYRRPATSFSRNYS